MSVTPEDGTDSDEAGDDAVDGEGQRYEPTVVTDRW